MPLTESVCVYILSVSLARALSLSGCACESICVRLWVDALPACVSESACVYRPMCCALSERVSRVYVCGSERVCI
jgi:hypothetical protein